MQPEENDDAVAPALPNFSSLAPMPELLGHIATFLDIHGGDMLSYCRVVGPGVSSVVRHCFLQNNVDYLRYAVSLGDLYRGRPPHVPTNGAPAPTFAAPKEKVLEWMEVNTDWKDRCKAPDIEGGAPFSVFRTTAKDVRDMRFKKSLGGLIAFAGCRSAVLEATMAETEKASISGLEENPNIPEIDSAPKEGDTLVSVNDVAVVRGASAGNAVGPLQLVWHDDGMLQLVGHDEIAPDTEVVFEFRVHPDLLFRAPYYIVRLDLDVIIRVMVEELGMEAKLESYRGLGLTLTDQSLLLSPTPASLLYLLTRPCFVQQCNTWEDNRRKLIHSASFDLELPLAAFDAFVSHPDIDVNVTNWYGETPLHFVCGSPGNPNTSAKIRLLLEAGADPTLVAGNGTTAVDVLSSRIAWLDDESVVSELTEALNIMSLYFMYL